MRNVIIKKNYEFTNLFFIFIRITQFILRAK